ncbi:MAG: NYN domain-containing protein [Bacteroidota bacterium]
MEAVTDLKLAVLIDAENVPYQNVKAMLEEITKYGIPTTKRIYGDWTRNVTSGWKGVLLENAITPIQQYSYTSGKNSSDSAMIIDAMDILYSGKVNGFCIVSSDSDFTRLAIRLRESGMKVIGIGEKKTPNPFIVACDKFIYLEILNPLYQEAESEPEKTDKEAPVRKSLHSVDKETIKLISASITDLADEGGWAFLGDVGNLINKKRPEFDPRNYGFLKLTPMLKALTRNFEIDERKTDNSNIKHVYIRVKKPVKPKPATPRAAAKTPASKKPANRKK